MPAASRAIIAALLMAAFVGAWQMWADSGRTQSTHPADYAPDIDSLLEVKTPESTPQQAVDYDGFRLSFNADKHVPNWVAWELTADETQGDVKRENKFYSDPAVKGCPETYDYSYSGYDRGHMCPAGDMKWSRDAMHHTFSLANICPQAKTLNTGTWMRLEEKCRTWAKADSAIIVICGPVLTDNLREAIGDTRVAVPERFFKVVLAPYATPMRGIGFLMNNGKVDGGMQQTAVSIDDVERATGLDFFAALPDSIEAEVESQCDFPYWSHIRPKKHRK